MNQTWIGVSNADKVGTRLDQNNFLLPVDLFLNDTFSDVSNDINLIYQSFFSSSTIVSDLAKNSSSLNRTALIHPFEDHGVSTSVGKLILTFLMSTMAFLTVAGNFLVILAFICEPTIRTYSNYFILNLSIADLLIGLIWWVHYGDRADLSGLLWTGKDSLMSNSFGWCVIQVVELFTRKKLTTSDRAKEILW